jgi:hypothetical protein
MLRRKLSEREMIIYELNMKGMYTFLYVYSRVDSVVCMLLQYDIPSVKMFMHVSVEV